MQHLYNPAVGDVVIVEREDRWGDRIPRHYRMYIAGTRSYLFRARIVRLCPDKRYNRVVPIPWNGGPPSREYSRSRKAYKTKIYCYSSPS
jgi:hypothetical protein